MLASPFATTSAAYLLIHKRSKDKTKVSE